MGIWSWSKTAGSNTTLESVSAAEGMDPGLVNNLIRAVAAGLAAWRDDTGGQLTAGGSANALTLTTNGTIAALADGQRVSFVAASSNTAAATINVDTRGALAIRKITRSSTNDTALVAGDIRANGHYDLQYDASANAAAGAWILLNPAVSVPATELSFHANKGGSDQGAFAPSTPKQVTFGNQVWDEGATYASNEWVPGVGRHRVDATVQIDAANLSDQDTLALDIYVNGSTALATTRRASGGFTQSISVGGLIEISNASHAVQVWLTVGGSGNKTVSGGATVSYFSGYRVSL